MRPLLRRALGALAILAGLTLLVAAVVPFVVPLPPAPGTVPPTRLAPEGDYYVAGVLRMFYQSPGEGEPVIVLLHGFGGGTPSFKPVVEHAVRRNRVLAFDRPGFGVTVRPLPPYEGANPYSLEAATEQSLALMDYLGIGKTVLVAHSAGAAVALQIAASHPERVDGLLLECPSISGASPPEFVRTLMRSPWGRFYGPLYVRRTFPAQAERLVERSFAQPDRLTPEIRAQYLRPLKAEDWDRGLWELAAAPGETTPRGLGDIAVPVTVVYGAEDSIVSPEESRRVAGEIPGAETVEIPDAGHIPHEEQPDAFNAALDGLLRRIAESE